MIHIPQSSLIPSQIIQFLNMISIEDLMEDSIVNELKEDLKKECLKYGEISDILILRPNKETGVSGPSVGKIFIKFNHLKSAKIARKAIAGKRYNGRLVFASFYPIELFTM